MATRPQEVSLNLANVKFSSPQHFQIQSLELTVWFRAVKRRRGGGEKKKRKIYTKEEEDTRIIRLRQSTITSYFPRYRSNQFSPVAEKQSTGPPKCLSTLFAALNIRRAGLRYSRIRYNHDPVEPPSPNRRRRERKKKEKGGGMVVFTGSYLIPSPNFPFFVSPFPRSLDVFPPSFPVPRNYLFFFYTLSATRLSLSPSFVIDYGPFETRCRLTGGRKKSTIRIS